MYTTSDVHETDRTLEGTLHPVKDFVGKSKSELKMLFSISDAWNVLYTLKQFVLLSLIWICKRVSFFSLLCCVTLMNLLEMLKPFYARAPVCGKSGADLWSRQCRCQCLLLFSEFYCWCAMRLPSSSGSGVTRNPQTNGDARGWNRGAPEDLRLSECRHDDLTMSLSIHT